MEELINLLNKLFSFDFNSKNIRESTESIEKKLMNCYIDTNTTIERSNLLPFYYLKIISLFENFHFENIDSIKENIKQNYDDYKETKTEDKYVLTLSKSPCYKKSISLSSFSIDKRLEISLYENKNEKSFKLKIIVFDDKKIIFTQNNDNLSDQTDSFPLEYNLSILTHTDMIPGFFIGNFKIESNNNVEYGDDGMFYINNQNEPFSIKYFNINECFDETNSTIHYYGDTKLEYKGEVKKIYLENNNTILKNIERNGVGEQSFKGKENEIGIYENDIFTHSIDNTFYKNYKSYKNRLKNRIIDSEEVKILENIKLLDNKKEIEVFKNIREKRLDFLREIDNFTHAIEYTPTRFKFCYPNLHEIVNIINKYNKIVDGNQKNVSNDQKRIYEDLEKYKKRKNISNKIVEIINKLINTRKKNVMEKYSKVDISTLPELIKLYNPTLNEFSTLIKKIRNYNKSTNNLNNNQMRNVSSIKENLNNIEVNNNTKNKIKNYFNRNILHRKNFLTDHYKGNKENEKYKNLIEYYDYLIFQKVLSTREN